MQVGGGDQFRVVGDHRDDPRDRFGVQPVGRVRVHPLLMGVLERAKVFGPLDQCVVRVLFIDLF